MCLFNAQCPEQLASCCARIPNCKARSSCWGGPSQAHSHSGLLRRFPGGLFFFFLFFSLPQWRWSSRRQPSPLFTSRPRPLRQWRDSAAGPISSGWLPQDKCESSTSLFYQLIGPFSHMCLLGSGFFSVFEPFHWLIAVAIWVPTRLGCKWADSWQKTKQKNQTDCAGRHDTEQRPCNAYRRMKHQQLPQKIWNCANLKVFAIHLNYHSLFKTDNKTDCKGPEKHLKGWVGPKE